MGLGFSRKKNVDYLCLYIYIEMEKDSRNYKTRAGLKDEKWFRRVQLQSMSPEHALIANPTQYKINRHRSESPPSKRYRTDKGINKGHAPACSHCRPEICKRMSDTADLYRQLKHDSSLYKSTVSSE